MPVTCRHLAVHGQHSPREVVEKTTLKVDWERAEREVAKRVPKVQRTATKWFNGTRDLVSVKQIEEAIIAEDPNLVTGFLATAQNPDLENYEVKVRKTGEEYFLLEAEIAGEIADEIAASGMASGSAAWAALPSIGIKVSGSFTISNPYVVPGAKARVGWLITEVRNGTQLGLRESVANVISQSYETQVGTRAAARQIREMIGLLPHQANAVHKIRERLVGQGMTGTQLANRIRRETEKRLRYRANMIARTEMRRAQATGRHDAWKVARDQGAFKGKDAYVEWVAGLSDRTCPICADLHGTQTLLGKNFMSTDNIPSDRSVENETPPIHPLCRCTTILRIE